MTHYLGIDIGTFESKGVLIDGEGDVVASAARPHKMLVPQPGWAEHRPEEDWWGEFSAISRELLDKSGVAPGSVRAVGASGIGPCMLPVDAAGRPLMNAVLYGVDTRATKEIADLKTEIGADRVLERCGNALTSQSVGPKILWLQRNHPDLYDKTAKIHSAQSFLVMRLTGAHVLDHYTASGSTPLYDAEKQGWTDDLAPDIVDLGRLPEPVWTTEIAGTVTAEAAAATGLAEGTPVIAGTVDAAAEALSVGVAAPGDMMLMYGSTVFVILVTADRVTDHRLWHAPWLFEGQHAAMAGLATSGTLTHWFRDQFGREMAPADAFPALAREAGASPPGARGLVVLPYFSGERTPIHDPDARGTIFGLDLTHERGDIYRALLEGIACGTRHVVDTYREVGRPPERIVAVGGGTKNAVWLQATSDHCEQAQAVCEKTVGAAYGDAFLAALAVGDVAAGDIAKWNPVAETVPPRPETKPVYRRQYDVFRTLYERTADLMAMAAGK